MGYIDKNNNVFMNNIIHYGYLKNKDGKSANPTLSISFNFNIVDNKASKPSYSVRLFDDEKTSGYTRTSFDNYAEAKECYDNLFTQYHVED
jgi:hypothetical protein